MGAGCYRKYLPPATFATSLMLPPPQTPLQTTLHARRQQYCRSENYQEIDFDKQSHEVDVDVGDFAVKVHEGVGCRTAHLGDRVLPSARTCEGKHVSGRELRHISISSTHSSIAAQMARSCCTNVVYCICQCERSTRCEWAASHDRCKQRQATGLTATGRDCTSECDAPMLSALHHWRGRDLHQQA
jgi:hypothetical protein